MIQSTPRTQFAALLLISLVLIATAEAEIPRYVSYQGKITDAGGTPVTDGSYTMRFRIYDAAAAGALLWDSGSQSVTTSQGVVNVLLGESPQPALGLDFDTDYWLLVTFQGINQTPRVRLTSAGYSYMASGLVPGTEVVGSVSGAAITGTNTLPSGYGLWGTATATTGDGFGGCFESASSSGRGVFGLASSTLGSTYGVFGVNTATGGAGVVGSAAASTGMSDGVYGQTSAPSGRGVHGYATSSTGVNYGVYGATSSPSGYAGYFLGNTRVTGNLTVDGTLSGSGIGDITAVTAGTGLYGGGGSGDVTLGVLTPLSLSASNANPILQGINTQATGNAVGVHGRSNSTSGRGVEGFAAATTGNAYGVYGSTDSSYGTGVRGYAGSTSSATGVAGESRSTAGSGVHGWASATSGVNFGVSGQSDSPTGHGVYGTASSTTGINFGVSGYSSSTSGHGVYGAAASFTGVNYGVYGRTNSPSGYAGFFEGNARVTGNLTVDGALSGSGIGDITSVNAGTGLDGGATSGDATLSVEVPLSLTASNVNPIIKGMNTMTSGNANGVYGSTASTQGAGVRGYASAPSGSTSGGFFTAASTSGNGVYALASATEGNTYGVHGLSYSTHGWGVFGHATATEGSTKGVEGESNSTGGVGVRGVAGANTGLAYGGEFQSNSTAGRGVCGNAVATSGATYGGYFSSRSISGTGVYGIVDITSNADGLGVNGFCFPAEQWGIGVRGEGGYRGVHGVSIHTTGSLATYGVYGEASGAAVNWGVYASGDLGASGTKSAIVRTEDGPKAVYCMESTEVWFEEFGRGELYTGEATVQLKSDFLQTVTIDDSHPMMVFITPGSDIGRWWVEEGIREFRLFAPDAPDGARFSYRVVAKRSGYEDIRLEARPDAYADHFLYPVINDVPANHQGEWLKADAVRHESARASGVDR